MNVTTARSRPTSVAGTAALLLGLVAMLLAFVPLLQAPAHAVQVCEDAEDGCSGPPAAECFGLAYLNKFEFDDETGGGAFDQGVTTEHDVPGDDTYSFTGTTATGSVTVTYTVVEDDGKYEVHSVTWSSTVGIDRVWLKAGGDTDESVAYDEEFGPETETVAGNAFSHITFCYDIGDPSVELTHACVEGTSRITVTITNPDEVEFSYDVEINDEVVATLTEAGSTTYDGTDGDLLEVVNDGDVLDELAFQDCSVDEPEPTVELSTACEGTQATATVTIDNDGDEELSVEVFIDNVSQGTITETTTFDGAAESVLRAEWGEDESAEVTFQDCTEDGPLLSAASFTVGSECQTNLPALTYDATVSETADDPVGDITLTVSDASGQLGQATFSASEAGSLALPTELEGETVAVSWDFDDTVLEQTLASGCASVLGAVDEREEEPAALPTTEVKGEQLPNAGFKEDLLLLLGGGFLALGCSLLLYDRRRYGVTA